MRRLLVLLFPALIAVFAALPASAQKFLPKSILFKGDPEFSSQELMQAAGLKNGEILSYISMNSVAQQLMNTGMFDGVTFKFDGQDLVFYLTPAAQLLPVRLENLPLAPAEDVNAKLHSLIPLYHGKVPPTGGVTDDVQKDLENILAAEGIHATIAGVLTSDPGSQKATALTYSITSPPVLIKVAQVDGVSPAYQSSVQAVLADVVKNPFDEDTSAGNLERAIALFYDDQGYAAAKVHAARSGGAVATADSILVPYIVTVQEGRVYKLAGMQLPAGAPVAQSDVDKVLAPHPGGPVQGVRVRTALSLVAASYRSKGYLDCKVTPTPQFDDAAGTVTYKIGVDPGPVYHLAFVKFDNMSDATRRLLMRYWQMMPGDVFDQTYVNTFIPNAQSQDRTLAQTLRGVKFGYTETEDLQSHTVNLVIRLGDNAPAAQAAK